MIVQLDGKNLHLEHIARQRPLDIQRTGCRIDVGPVQTTCILILTGQLTAEAIQGLKADSITVFAARRRHVVLGHHSNLCIGVNREHIRSSQRLVSYTIYYIYSYHISQISGKKGLLHSSPLFAYSCKSVPEGPPPERNG